MSAKYKPGIQKERYITDSDITPISSFACLNIEDRKNITDKFYVDSSSGCAITPQARFQYKSVKNGYSIINVYLILPSVKILQFPGRINGKSVYSIALKDTSNISNVKKIVISNGTRFIEDNCFANMKSLASAIIASTVSTFGKSCFADCPKLKRITIYASKPQNCTKENLFGDSNSKIAIIHLQGESDKAFLNIVSKNDKVSTSIKNTKPYSVWLKPTWKEVKTSYSFHGRKPRKKNHKSTNESHFIVTRKRPDFGKRSRINLWS